MLRHSPLNTSQTLTTLPVDPDMTLLVPNQQTDRAVLELSTKIWSQAPEDKFHIQTVPSSAPEATMAPVGEKDTEETVPIWPPSIVTRAPVCTSQTLTVVSFDPDAMNTSSGENAIEYTSSLCPSNMAK